MPAFVVNCFLPFERKVLKQAAIQYSHHQPDKCYLPGFLFPRKEFSMYKRPPITSSKFNTTGCISQEECADGN